MQVNNSKISGGKIKQSASHYLKSENQETHVSLCTTLELGKNKFKKERKFVSSTVTQFSPAIK